MPPTCWLNRKSVRVWREAICIVGIQKRKEVGEAITSLLDHAFLTLR